MKQYMMDFPDELHALAKIHAAAKGITLKELILQSVQEYLEAHGQRWTDFENAVKRNCIQRKAKRKSSPKG
jgi:hypothetical protein